MMVVLERRFVGVILLVLLHVCRHTAFAEEGAIIATLLRSTKAATREMPTQSWKGKASPNVLDPASALRITTEWGGSSSEDNDDGRDSGWHLMDFSDWDQDYIGLLDGTLSLGDPASSSNTNEDHQQIGPTMPPSSSPLVILSERAAHILEKCDMTEAERSQNIFQVLVDISVRPEDLTDPSSPRYTALQWIDEVDEAILCPPPTTKPMEYSQMEGTTGVRFIQRYTLALLYFSMNGPKWTSCSLREKAPCEPQQANINSTCVAPAPTRYLDSSHECLWYGSGCGLCGRNLPPPVVDDHLPLLQINLPHNNLAGTIPPEVLEQLTSLELLGLDGNHKIRGKLPPAIGALTNLRSLSLDGANLRGPLPEELFQLLHLRALDLQGNRFTGTLSTSIGNLNQLNLLQLDNNQFIGDIPSESLLHLQNLVVISVAGNQMVGSLDSICAQESSERERIDAYWNVAAADCAEAVECSCCDACGMA